MRDPWTSVGTGLLVAFADAAKVTGRNALRPASSLKLLKLPRVAMEGEGEGRDMDGSDKIVADNHDENSLLAQGRRGAEAEASVSSEDETIESGCAYLSDVFLLRLFASTGSGSAPHNAGDYLAPVANVPNPTEETPSGPGALFSGEIPSPPEALQVCCLPRPPVLFVEPQSPFRFQHPVHAHVQRHSPMGHVALVDEPASNAPQVSNGPTAP